MKLELSLAPDPSFPSISQLASPPDQSASACWRIHLRSVLIHDDEAFPLAIP
jgi:hypothetical protein